MQIPSSELQLNQNRVSVPYSPAHKTEPTTPKKDFELTKPSVEAAKPNSLLDPVNLHNRPSSLTTYGPGTLQSEAGQFVSRTHATKLQDFSLPSFDIRQISAESSSMADSISDEQMDAFLKKAFRLFDSEP